jgi:RNA polymerase sigma-70 factor (ECF subfamily)
MPPDADKFLPTRRSLLSKLKSWDNQDSWREFFETYWRLIYDVARKAGLDDAESEDLVQETILSVAKEMPGFKYDRSRGSFKGWLRPITRCRIADALRKRYRAAAAGNVEPANLAQADALAEVADPGGLALEAIWDREWEEHLRAAALARLKQRVKLEPFQIFELHVLQNWPVKDVAATLGVAVPTVYWVSQRVARLLKQLVRGIEAERP